MADLKPPLDRSGPLATQDIKPAPRPWSVSLLLIGVLIITVINLTRFILSLRDWSFLASRLTISPLYLAMSGLVWTVVGSILVWGLGRAKSWAPRLMQAVALTYALYFWLDLLFLRDHPVGGAGVAISMVLPTNWQFSAGVTVVSLVYIAWVFSRRKVKAYFGQVESERRQEQPVDEPED